MTPTRLIRPLALLASWLRARLTAGHNSPDHGGHAAEYAIGIGLSAAIALGLWAAYQNGIATVVGNWFFGGGS